MVKFRTKYPGGVRRPAPPLAMPVASFIVSSCCRLVWFVSVARLESGSSRVWERADMVVGLMGTDGAVIVAQKQFIWQLK